MNDRTDLMKAIIANPDDDTPRLMYADELEAIGSVRVPCPKCKDSGEPGWRHRHGASGPGYYVCEGCADVDNGDTRGTGFVLDTSHTDRAAAIRLQCEIAKRQYAGAHDDATCCVIGCEVCATKADLHDFAERFRTYISHMTAGGAWSLAWIESVLGATGSERSVARGWQWFWRRGFIQSVRMPGEDWAKYAHRFVWNNQQYETCLVCKGTGCGEPTYEPPAHKTCPQCDVPLRLRPNGGNPDYERWCPRCWRVISGRHVGYKDCPRCGRVGRRPRPVPEAAQPIQFVTLTGAAGPWLDAFEPSHKEPVYFHRSWPGIEFEIECEADPTPF